MVIYTGIRKAEHCCLVKSADAFIIPIAKDTEICTDSDLSHSAAYNKQQDDAYSPTNVSTSKLIASIFEILR